MAKRLLTTIPAALLAALLCAPSVSRAAEAAEEVEPPRNGCPAVWWNTQRGQETLNLDTATLADLNRICQAIVASRTEIRARSGAARNRYRQALLDLDLATATRALEELNATTRELAVSETTLKSEVLTRLDADQRTVLQTKHANLLKRRWLIDPARQTGAKLRRRTMQGMIPATETVGTASAGTEADRDPVGASTRQLIP